MNASTTPTSTMAGGTNGMPTPPQFATLQDQQRHMKQVLAGAFRIFSKLGFDEGVAGHITFRDPIDPETFWVNPFGLDFSLMTVSSLIRVDHEGNVIEGHGPLNRAAFAIHSKVHKNRPDVIAAAHAHSLYGKVLSTLNCELEPITQDSCAFFEDHCLYKEYGGVAIEHDEGQRISDALGACKAAILSSHGLLTVGGSVEEAVYWFISLEKCCQVQVLAQAAACGKPLKQISREAALQAKGIVGTPYAGWLQFNALYQRIKKEQPDFLN